MFEKRTRLRVKSLLEKQFNNFRELEQSLKNNLIDRELCLERSASEKVSLNRSPNERNMTRRTRSRRPRIHSIFQSGFCAVCHIQYSSLEEHVQSKRHLKLIGDDGNFISIKGLDSFLALDDVDSIEVNGKNCGYRLRTAKMPRTRTSSLARIKDAPMSPMTDSGHHLRSRKNINYMTPPLEEDSLTEKPEVVKEFRELRSSSRLLAKLADQMVENDEVWNSGRPKRSCNRQRISADERLVVDNKSYYKVEVLSSKLRSGVGPYQPVVKRPETPVDDKGLIVKFKKMRSSELVRLNNEAENFLFPKKDESSDDDEDEDEDSNAGDRPSRMNDNSSSISSDADNTLRKIKVEDDESMHSTGSESKGKRRRRTHAEAFIMDNQKYYKFETPGSRLRYHGSYLSPVPMKSKNNGDCVVKTDPDYEETTNNFRFNLEDYNFSFESVPRNELWYQTFQRRDKGEEKYTYLSDDGYWNPLILPYQLDYVPPLDPRECLSQYNQIKKCLTEPHSTSTSVTCSTPDPNASNSSLETPSSFVLHDEEDSKISATENSSSSTSDELKPLKTLMTNRRRSRKSTTASGGGGGDLVLNPAVAATGKNPRKSPRQHASTLAILSSLIQQRKRKSKRGGDLELKSSLPTIFEEPSRTSTAAKKKRSPKKSKVDYVAIVKGIEEDLASACCDEALLEVDLDKDEEIEFRSKVGIEDILDVYQRDQEEPPSAKTNKRTSKPGRKPGKRKKNRTGWPLTRSRRLRRDHVTKEEDLLDESTVDSVSVNADSEEGSCEEANSTDSIKKKEVKQEKVEEEKEGGGGGGTNSENNNKNDQSSLGDDDDVVVNRDDSNNCDLSNADRVGGKNDSSSNNNRSNSSSEEVASSDKVLTNKVNNSSDGFNIDLQYQPYVRVQKLDKNHIDNKNEVVAKRSNSPKRTNRGQRRMPASPKSPRMLRRPRGRWYRER